MWRNFIFIVFFCFSLSGCPDSDDQHSRSPGESFNIGTCQHEYNDEVLHIDSVISSDEAIVISDVMLTNFNIDGRAVSVDEINQQRNTNITKEGDNLRCVLPCSLGVMAGKWEFDVSSRIHSMKRESIVATYAAFNGGCPSSEDGGTHVNIAMEFSPIAGPCIHLYLDEVLHIDSASGRNTGSVISEVMLSQFSVDGIPISVRDFVNDPENDIGFAGRGKNVAIRGEKLHCVIPCSFGLGAAEWVFMAEADGYVSTQQVVEASFSEFLGGCPSYETGGSHTDIYLNESGY